MLMHAINSPTRLIGYVRTIGILVVLSLMLFLVPVGAEAAVEDTDDVVEEITFDDYRTLVDDLKTSDLPRSEAVVDGQTVLTFIIDSPELGEFEMKVVDLQNEDEFAPGDGMVQPQIGGGWDSGGPYVTFNNFDQSVLIGAGGAALVLAICAIPAVGQIACGVAGIIVAAATAYVVEYGRCPNKGDLKVYVATRRAYCT